jgi:hypothetical protein
LQRCVWVLGRAKPPLSNGWIDLLRLLWFLTLINMDLH